MMRVQILGDDRIVRCVDNAAQRRTCIAGLSFARHVEDRGDPAHDSGAFPIG
jgi:hypothetical protein